MLDPTLLYEFREFAGTIKVQDYILLYSFDTLEDYKEVIQTYARDHSLPILSVGRDYKWVDYSLSYAKESEWLSAFQNAGLVITDSFHGLVFSIKYHKQFVLLRRPDKYSKNESLLEELNIQTEYYTKENSIGTYLSQNKVNYSMVNELLQLKIKESSQYLLEGLNNICV